MVSNDRLVSDEWVVSRRSVWCKPLLSYCAIRRLSTDHTLTHINTNNTNKLIHYVHFYIVLLHGVSSAKHYCHSSQIKTKRHSCLLPNLSCKEEESWPTPVSTSDIHCDNTINKKSFILHCDIQFTTAPNDTDPTMRFRSAIAKVRAIALHRKTKTNTNPCPDPNRYRSRCPDPNVRIKKFIHYMAIAAFAIAGCHL